MPASGEHGARWWPWLKRGLTLGFFACIVALLVQRGRNMDWAQVGQSLLQYTAPTLATAGLLAMLSYALYASFDLIGRRYSRHRLSHRAVLSTALVSYAFNLNMGALVGGVGFRYRLYSRYGLSTSSITRVLGMSMIGNWIGYALLAGGVLASGALALPEQARYGDELLRVLGLLLFSLAPAYLALCAFSTRREWTVRGASIALPHGRMALLQLAVSTANWLVIAAIPYVLLESRIDYPLVLGALLLGAIAGVVTHVPAGIGVLEAVFLTVLKGQVDQAPLLAALLAYRALYYLLPLLIAVVAYLAIEARLHRPAEA